MKKLLFIPLLFICSIAIAAPAPTSVSGDTVIGSAFGEKTQAPPIAWDNFEDGSITTSATVGTWSSINHLTETSTLVVRSGSSYSAWKDFVYNPAYAGEVKAVFTAGSNSEKWYTYKWIYLDDNFEWGNTTYDGNRRFLSNIKYDRFWSTSESQTSNIYAAATWDINANGNVAVEGATSESFAYNINSFSKASITLGAWHLFEVQFKDSGIDEPNGEITVWFNGEVKAHRDDLILRDSENMDYKRPNSVGMYNAWSPNTGLGETDRSPNDFYMDDVYVDNSWARVMVGNNATFANCTHREIQIPTAWSDTSITVTWNQGSFTDRETAYLFVIDADGVASAGLEGYWYNGAFRTTGIPAGNISTGSGNKNISIVPQSGDKTITIQ